MIQYDLMIDIALSPIENTTAKVILLAIASYSNADGVCFPSQQKLSDNTAIPIRTVTRAVLWLEDQGFIRIVREHNKSNRYSIISMEENMTTDSRGAKMALEVDNNIIQLDSNSNSNTISTAKMAHQNDSPMFQAFWQAYPRRIGKGAARTAFKRALKFSSGHEIIQGALDYTKHCEEMGTEKQYIPHPSTWLNGERWEDDLESEKVETKKTVSWLNEL